MNIATIVRRTAADVPTAVALRLEEEELTYAEFLDRARRFATLLRGRGVEPGDRVGFLLPNGPEYLVGILGTWWAGAVAVPVNTLLPDGPLRHVLADSGVALLVTTPGEVERVRRLAADLPLITAGPEGELAGSIAAESPMEAVEPRLDQEDAVLMYTSGSTGVPKGVRQTHRNLTAHAEAVIDFHQITSDERVLNCMPLFHVGGLQLASLPALLRGGAVTFMPGWDVDRWLELAATLRPTYGGLISTMMIDVGNRTRDNPVQLDSFRVCLFGGSRTPTAAIERLAQGTGIHPTEMYGQTEQNGLVVSYRPGEERRADSMGRPLAQSVRTRVVAVGEGADIPPGSDEVGELWAHGDAVTPGYWNLEDPGKRHNGWLRTGDLVRRDADGYLYYVDRIDDMIVSGGENVFPQMVEEHLAGHPDLAEVAVIGTSHERWVQQVTAVVVSRRDGLTSEEVLGWCDANPHLTRLLKPKRVEIVEALPRTGTGKLNRPELRSMFP